MCNTATSLCRTFCVFFCARCKGDDRALPAAKVTIVLQHMSEGAAMRSKEIVDDQLFGGAGGTEMI